MLHKKNNTRLIYCQYCMYIVYKKIGETPLACARRILGDAHDKYTYAGRLDPMAEGLLLVLTDEECRHAKKYFHLTKVYEYSFAVGIATDTYDCLGRITASADRIRGDVVSRVRDAVSDLTGEITLPYPPYSSKTVNGIPLFIHARRGTAECLAVPERTVYIPRHTLTAEERCNTRTLADTAAGHVALVRGDFRQEAVTDDWRGVRNADIPCFSAVLEGSGGVYVRAVVNEIGRRIGYPTVTTAIKRIRIGDWTERDIYGQ